MTRLAIDGSTTVGQLEAFLRAEGNTNNARLRAEVTGKDAEGNKTYSLYVSNKASSLKDGLSFFKANNRNKAAETAVHKVFANFHRTARLDHKSGDALLKNVTQRLAFDGKHALRGDAVRSTAEAARLLEAKLGGMGRPALLNAGEKLLTNGPPLGNLAAPFTLRQPDLMQIAEHALAGDPTPATVSHMAGVITDALEAAGATPEQMKALALSSGLHVKQAIREAVTECFRRSWSEVPESFGKLLDAGFNAMAGEVFGTRQVGAAPLDGVDRPVIAIGDKRYEPTAALDKGGFGSVFLYTNAQDPSDKVVLKLFHETPLGSSPSRARQLEALHKQAEQVKEVHNHERAQAGDSPNVLKMRAPVKLETGQLAVLLEAAPHGTLQNLGSALNRGIGSVDQANSISREDATLVALTVLRDVIRGLDAVHRQGIVHHDVKAMNCMIGQDGQAKIIDFGTSAARAQVKMSALTDLENFCTMAPELQLGRQARDDARAAETAQRLGALKAEFAPQVDRMVHDQAEDVDQNRANIWSQMNNRLKEAVFEEIVDSQSPAIGKDADIWGVGIVAQQLFLDTTIFPDNSFISDVSIGVRSWATGPDGGYSDRKAVGGDSKPIGERRVPTDGSAPEHLMPSTGNDQVDDLLNRLLAPDPQKRISFEEALKHPVFDDPKIGSDAIRALAVKVAHAPDPAAEAQAV